MPVLENTDDDTMNVVLAQQEAKRQCAAMFSDTKSRNYKRCVLFLLPDILDNLECDDCDFQYLPSTGDDFDMSQRLRTICFAKMDEFEWNG